MKCYLGMDTVRPYRDPVQRSGTGLVRRKQAGDFLGYLQESGRSMHFVRWDSKYLLVVLDLY